MSQITITLPDGSSRELAAGAPVRAVAEAISPGLAKAALAGIVDGKAGRSGLSAAEGLPRSASSPTGVRRRCRCYRHSTAHLLARGRHDLFPDVQCGIGPATDEGLLLRLRRPRPFVPEDLETIERKMTRPGCRGFASSNARCGRARKPTTFFGKRGEPLKVQLIEEKTEGQKEVSCYTIKDTRHVRRLLRRAARAVDRQAESLQAAHDLERILEGRRAQPADAARLRHGVLSGQRPEGAPDADRGSEEARPSQARARARSVLFHPWAPGAAFWLDKGTTLYNLLANYMRGVLLPGRLRRSEDADHLQQGAVGDVRPLGALPPEHVPHRRPKRSRWRSKP